MGNLVIFALMSWLPCVVLFGVVWLVGAGLDGRPGGAGRGGLLAAGAVCAAVAAGWVAGAMLLAPAAEVPRVAAVVAAALAACAVAAWFLSAWARALAAAAFVAGTHLPVLASGAGEAGQGDGQSVFWVMPVLDLWLVVGIPVLVIAVAVAVVRARWGR